MSTRKMAVQPLHFEGQTSQIILALHRAEAAQVELTIARDLIIMDPGTSRQMEALLTQHGYRAALQKTAPWPGPAESSMEEKVK